MKVTINNEKLKQGDPETFRLFFELFYPKLMTLACRFVDKPIAEDLVQEVFTSFWEQRLSLETQNIQSYMFKWLQNRCLNYLKHQTVVEEYESRIRIAEARIEYLNNTNDFNEVLDKVITQDLHDIIETSINKLPPKSAEAFRLSFYEDLPHKKIAEVMNISHRTVEGHIHYAIKFLRLELKDILLLYFMFCSIN